MAVRNRIRTESFTGSRKQKFSGQLMEQRSYVSSTESCSDDDADGDNSIFTVNRTTRSGGLIAGIESSNNTGYIWYDYPCGYMYDSFLTNHYSVPGQKSDGTYATEVAARTQPGRAAMVSLEYASELHSAGSQAKDKFGKQLDKLSKHVPHAALKKLKAYARINLMVQFGLMPIISDIKTLLRFQGLVDDRVKEYERLYGPRGLRRTLQLFTGTTMGQVSQATIQSQGVTLHADIHKTTKVEVRGHIRWHAVFPLRVSDKELRDTALRAMLGYQLDPYTLYELMPWSWFIDYFSNLGNIVKASRNMLTMRHDAVRIMEHRRTISRSLNHDIEVQSGNQITCTPIFVVNETKTRRIVSPIVFNAQDVVLSGQQLSILGSLAVVKL